MARPSQLPKRIAALERFIGECELHFNEHGRSIFPENKGRVNVRAISKKLKCDTTRIYESPELKALINEACEFFGLEGIHDDTKKAPAGDKQIEQKIKDARTNSAKDRAAALQSNALYESVHIANLELTEENAKLKNLVKTLRARIEQYESGVFGGVNE